MSPYFFNECYKSCFNHVSLFKISFDLVIFVQNVITRSSSEMTDISLVIYARLLQSFCMYAAM